MQAQAWACCAWVPVSRREDSPDSVRIQVTLDIPQTALQGLLYTLESRTPYVFVDSLTLQPSTQRAGPDPMLRLTLSLHALWRRESA